MLTTDVYLPAAEGPLPVVVHRTPYGRTSPFLLHLALRLGREGVGTVLQDCRGYNASNGQADLRREEADGSDTLAWVGEQPWCNGHVGLLGVSVSSLPLFSLALASPSAAVEIRALVNIMGGADLRSFFYRGGALVLHWALPWLHLMASQHTVRGVPEQPWSQLYRNLPLANQPESGGFNTALWRDIVSQPGGGPVWRNLEGSNRLAKVRTPTLHVGGWSDFLLSSTLESYFRTAGNGEREPKLAIGPWSHASLFSDPVLAEMLAAWFATRLIGAATESAASRYEEPNVLLRLEDSSGWLGFTEFPPRCARPFELYLVAGSPEGHSAHHGRLLEVPPAAGHSLEFTYDPIDPVPTDGGPVWPFAAAELRPGPTDASRVETRGDVLVFTGAPLAEDLQVAGPAEAELWVASSAPATDFSVRLVDVDPQGTPRVVQDGIVRLQPRPDDIPIGASGPRRIGIDLAAVGHRFGRGHRVRIEVSSSNFPKYDRHLNRAVIPGLDDAPQVAKQSVFLGGDTPSRIRMSVLSGKVDEWAIPDPGATFRGHGAARPSRLRGWLRLPAAPIGAIGRRLGAELEAQTARPMGAMGHVVGWLLLLVNPRLNRWTLEALAIGRRDRVLEIGFGPGATIRRLARRATEGRVAGIDHSQVMVAQARARNAKAVRQGRVDLHLGEVSHLPFQDECFDKVIAVNSVQLWRQPEADLLEVRRVLRPGGLAALSFGQPRWTTSDAAVRAAARRLVAQLAGAGMTVASIEVRRLGPLRSFRVVARKAKIQVE